MRRALRLAANGRGFTAPNPMVGAVIVAPDGRVIGEGWHRRYGEGHAEVNAVASVKDEDRHLLNSSTIYVTLEPCSHYGKTPPCALLLARTGFPRVVVGAGDPNPKVNGRGIAMIRETGAEVVTGVLAEESIALNKVFFTAQTLHRPYIYIKWAQSADGYMDAVRSDGGSAFAFSTPMTRMTTMKLRSEYEALLTTASTVIADNPSMTVRGWDGRSPRRFVLDRKNSLVNPVMDKEVKYRMFEDDGEKPVLLTATEFPEVTNDILAPFKIMLEKYGVTSVLVEAGPRYLSALLKAGLWDEARVEIAPVTLGDKGRHPAPVIPDGKRHEEHIDGNLMIHIHK